VIQLGALFLALTAAAVAGVNVKNESGERILLQFEGPGSVRFMSSVEVGATAEVGGNCEKLTVIIHATGGPTPQEVCREVFRSGDRVAVRKKMGKYGFHRIPR